MRIDKLLDLLFPPKCPFCHRLLREGEEYWCSRCQRELPWAAGPAGQRELEFLSGCVSPLFYRDQVREGVHRYKFQNRPGYAGSFGLLMSQSVRDAWPDAAFEAVTWVPLSKRRLRRRGYDQARLLAEAVSERLGLPCVSTLVKARHTPAQSLQADGGSRRANVLGAYATAPGADLAGKTLLLCDDVVTSGSTLSECARVLRTAGAARVYAVTLARARN